MKNVALLHKLPDLRRSDHLRRCLLLLALVIPSVFTAYAQVDVKGKVTDEAGAGMPGVNILVKNTVTGTTSDVNGEYAISVPSGDAILVFSFIGYNTQEVSVGSQSSIDLSLVPNVNSLEEVVVVGYGTQKKSDVTGSLVQVDSKTLREVPVANMQMALQGRAAGVEVQRMGTAPGASARIRIRGERSIFGSNDPLIVVDGIPFEGNLNDINPDEITSINVLKDASATAIYGSRGANGIILVTTKRGKAGETRLTVDSYYGVSTVARKYKMYNAEEYSAMRDASAYPYGYMPEEVEGIKQGRNTDWQDLMYETGYITNHNIGLNGGNEKSTFSIGAGYFKESTILPGQDFERFSIKASIDSKVGKKFRIGFSTINNLNMTNGAQFLNQQANTPGAYGGSMMYNILATSPLMPAYNDDGTIFRAPFGNADDASANYSPLYLKENNNDWVDKMRGIRTFNSMYAEYDIIDGLKYRLNAGLEFGQNNSAQFRGADNYFRVKQGNQARVRNQEDYSWTVENMLVYDKTFNEKHHVTFTGLYSGQQKSWWSTQVSKDSITADFVEHFNMGLSSPSAQTVLDGGEQTSGIVSYMGRVNYAFSDRYLVTATWRRDGSSRLAVKWHDYSAFAFGWNAINESFMKDQDIVSNLKLRVGYGETSNQSVDPYTSLGGVSNSNQGVPIKYNYGVNTRVSGYLPVRLPDKTIDWEYTKNTNIGIDFGFLNDKITGTIDWYQAKTENLLYNYQMPITSGYQDAFQTNLGSIENKGMEIALSWEHMRTSSGFTWSSDINWYYNRNEILSLSEGEDRSINNGLFVGHPLSAIYDYKKIGVWQEDEADLAAEFGQLPGQLKLADLQGPEEGSAPDKKITEVDRMVIGSQQAKWQAGLTTRLGYKGIDLTIVAFMRYGGTLLSYLHAPNGAYLTTLNGQRNNLNVEYWTPENRSNDFPAPSASLPSGAATAWSTLAYYDATFVKIRSMSIGYTLPKSVTSKINANNLRFYFTAQNPFLLFSPYVSKYNGVDPEPTGQGQTGIVSTSGTYRTQGPNQNLVISASTPPTRSFILGLNLSF
jgi:TonB-dependent starch-binding outer membrane protein SusC